MNMKRLITATAVVSALISGTALAETSPLFIQLDTDQDGAISAAEAAVDAGLSAAWENVDINKDGKIEPVEFSAFEEQGKEAAQ